MGAIIYVARYNPIFLEVAELIQILCAMLKVRLKWKRR